MYDVARDIASVVADGLCPETGNHSVLRHSQTYNIALVAASKAIAYMREPQTERDKSAYAAVGLLENLRDAIRSPEDTPARQEYINYLLARADVILKDVAKDRFHAL